MFGTMQGLLLYQYQVASQGLSSAIDYAVTKSKISKFIKSWVCAALERINFQGFIIVKFVFNLNFDIRGKGNKPKENDCGANRAHLGTQKMRKKDIEYESIDIRRHILNF